VAVWPASFSIDEPSPSATESPPTQICNGCPAVGVRSGGIVVVVGAGAVVGGGGTVVTAVGVVSVVAMEAPARSASGPVEVVGRGVAVGGSSVVVVVIGAAATGTGLAGMLWRMPSIVRAGRSRAKAALRSPAASATCTATSRRPPNGSRSAMRWSERALRRAAPP
jgi:hypothetical protein